MEYQVLFYSLILLHNDAGKKGFQWCSKAPGCIQPDLTKKKQKKHKSLYTQNLQNKNVNAQTVMPVLFLIVLWMCPFSALPTTSVNRLIKLNRTNNSVPRSAFVPQGQNPQNSIYT